MQTTRYLLKQPGTTPAAKSSSDASTYHSKVGRVSVLVQQRLAQAQGVLLPQVLADALHDQLSNHQALQE
jgi:hypothetical protein